MRDMKTKVLEPVPQVSVSRILGKVFEAKLKS